MKPRCPLTPVCKAALSYFPTRCSVTCRASTGTSSYGVSPVKRDVMCHEKICQSVMCQLWTLCGGNCLGYCNLHIGKYAIIVSLLVENIGMDGLICK